MQSFFAAGTRFLVISPHPDDEAIGCGGLIAKAKACHYPLAVLYLCIGPSPRQLMTGMTETATRFAEINAASQFGGFSTHNLYRNEQLHLDHKPQIEIIDTIEDLVADFRPDVVCVPFGQSYNQDHRAAHLAAVAALRPVPRAVRHFVPWVLEYEEPYSAWHVGGAGGCFQPNLFVDISDYLPAKLGLMRCHASQDRPDPWPRSCANLERLARARGTEIGVQAAEAYRVLRGQIE